MTFAVRGAPSRWLQCHCSRCRRARSAAHGSNTFFPLAQFSWQTGRELVRGHRVPEAQRFTSSFCTRCGGAAPTERENVPFVLVPAALFDSDPGTRLIPLQSRTLLVVQYQRVNLRSSSATHP